MSIIDAVRPRRAPGAPKAPAVATKIAAAEQRLSALEAERPAVALDAVEGVAGGAERLETLGRQIETVKAEIATLRAAHSAARDHDEAVERAQRAQLQKTQVAAVRAHLAARDKAAEEMTAALAVACEQFRIMVE